MKDKHPVPKWQIILSTAIGLGLILLMVIIAIAIPNPTTFQMFVFQGCSAISLGALGAMIPGMLHVESAYARATGAIGLVLIGWFSTPSMVDLLIAN
jgi:putative Mn2+ efflux pump MntP